MIEGPKTGWASSVSVTTSPLTPGRWNWTASGRCGMTCGSATNRDRAWEMARTAQIELEHGMAPKGSG